jgi:hypothetical protein
MLWLPYFALPQNKKNHFVATLYLYTFTFILENASWPHWQILFVGTWLKEPMLDLCPTKAIFICLHELLSLLYNCFGKNIPYKMAMASRRCVRIIYNNSETFVFAGSSSIINSGLIFNPLQVYCGGIISLEKLNFTTKVLIAVVAIIISLILFIVGFLLVLMSGLHKIKFATLYSPYHVHGTFLHLRGPPTFF